jgi:hypothetical protein
VGIHSARNIHRHRKSSVAALAKKLEGLKMIGYSKQGDEVILTMTERDYELLLFLLGGVTGATAKDPECWAVDVRVIIGLVNRLNQGNPHFIPYK